MPPRKKPGGKKAAAPPPEPEPPATVLGRTIEQLGDAFGPRKGAQGYEAFHDWVERSIEAVRPELAAALFPVFAHAFLKFADAGDDAGAEAFLDRWAGHHLDRHAKDVAALRRVGAAGAASDPYEKPASNSPPASAGGHRAAAGRLVG